ncbi:MAG: hypothetical protein ABIQ73_13595 [Acidimicrobiales bacterium]
MAAAGHDALGAKWGRSGNAVFLPDLDSYRKQYPEILDDTIAAGVKATA